MYDALNTMLDDCRAAGLDVRVCSAYRTQATQTRLHNNKIARLRAAGYSAEKAREEAARWVAAPGTSEHQTGLAVDLVSGAYQILDEKQGGHAGTAVAYGPLLGVWLYPALSDGKKQPYRHRL